MGNRQPARRRDRTATAQAGAGPAHGGVAAQTGGGDDNGSVGEADEAADFEVDDDNDDDVSVDSEFERALQEAQDEEQGQEDDNEWVRSDSTEILTRAFA